MRQFNFVIIFVICLAFVLFSLENTEPAGIQIIEGVQVQAPLSVELLLAMGIGAVLAWVFSVWTQLQRVVETQKEAREIREKEEAIVELQQDVERYKAELQEQRRLLPAAEGTAPNEGSS
ncbi:DUF1049 domain-containing protein [Leptolyngbya sp. 'hensonii']|uniref:lipopolysaccharide assembly protein LapA domain-containing protein n=1 Tax=Leptolyngbya sp. 'hensonii' TaxID=1922337 RepID=UPI0009501C40|nr:LapA family protein [Leptolyngbya sp. 'hensonii']OLP17915.1 DUF1049 domain-containing protein [Leptolyngbya sp. 'hensonii']